jgi:hypothetical protein
MANNKRHKDHFVNGLCRWDGHRQPGRVKVASREDKIRQTTPPGRQSLALGGLREAPGTPMSGCHHPPAIPKSDGNASHSHHFPLFNPFCPFSGPRFSIAAWWPVYIHTFIDVSIVQSLLLHPFVYCFPQQKYTPSAAKFRDRAPSHHSTRCLTTVSFRLLARPCDAELLLGPLPYLRWSEQLSS